MQSDDHTSNHDSKSCSPYSDVVTVDVAQSLDSMESSVSILPHVSCCQVMYTWCGCHDIEQYCAQTETKFSERRCISPTAGLFSALFIYGLSFPAMIVFWTLALGNTLLLRHWIMFQGACVVVGVVLPSIVASIVRHHPIHFVSSLLTFVWIGAFMSIFVMFIGLAHFGHATDFIYPARDWNYEHWDDGRNIGQGFVIFIVLALLLGTGIGACCSCIVACGKSYHEAKVRAAIIQQQKVSHSENL